MLRVWYYKRVFLCYILVLLSLLVLFPVSVMADRSEVDSVITVDKNASAIGSICSQANSTVGRKKILVYTGSDGLLSFSNKLYSKLDVEEKREFMKTALKATRESGLGTQVKNKVYNFIANQDNPTSAAVKYLQTDASADFVAARSWFRPFSGVIGTIMGCLCLAIFIFMSMSIVFDIAYLVLPGFQALLEHGEENKRPFGVSREAWKANIESEKESEPKSVMTIYLKKRIPVMILISICLGYVISGMIYDIVVFFIDSFAVSLAS